MFFPILSRNARERGFSRNAKQFDKSASVRSDDLRSIIPQDIHSNDFQTAGSFGTESPEDPRPYGGWADPRERRKCAPRSSVE